MNLYNYSLEGFLDEKLDSERQALLDEKLGIEDLALLGFSYFQKLGPQQLNKLRIIFTSYAKVFEASRDNLERTGLKQKLINDFILWRQTFSFEKTFINLSRENISFVSCLNVNYPNLLKEIPSPPLVLYYKGARDRLSDYGKNRLAVVGARQHSYYSNKLIDKFIPDLVSYKLEIVSGLALGVDTLAHNKTLEVGGQTIAVLGTGLDFNSFYPRENLPLAKKIILQGGLLLTEFPPQTAARPQNFPRRNRIISGLCQATLVVEAQEKSGSLITAAQSLDQNREVLAVPGNIFSEFSRGPNNLIKAGAKVVVSSDDILEVYGFENKPKSKSESGIKIESKNAAEIELITKKSRQPGFISKNDYKIKIAPKEKLEFKNEAEKIVYKILQNAQAVAEILTNDEIIKISQLDTALINSTLSILELRGLVKSSETGYYIN